MENPCSVTHQFLSHVNYRCERLREVDPQADHEYITLSGRKPL
uniref:Uncharacterized protein n=1 Tax=Anguilla anguilla TaxID=7936 RepID=A0A0E9TSD4_ANGAN